LTVAVAISYQVSLKIVKQLNFLSLNIVTWYGKMNKIAKAPLVVHVNESMNAAAKEIKENMTEVQKSALYLKEVTIIMEKTCCQICCKSD
jgi:hypothetical protein